MDEHCESFWAHIEDLRKTLLRSALIIGIGLIAVLSFYQPFLHFFTAGAFENSAAPISKQRIERFQVKNQTTSDQLFELPLNSKILTNRQQPEKHRDGYVYYQLTPGETLFYDQVITSPLLIMGPVEGLVLVFKVCFWVSLALTSPLWGWVWLQFILPGIKEKEKAILIPFLLCSLICMAMGCALAYFVTVPLANAHLSLFNQSIGQNTWTLAHYVNYVLFVCLGHAIAAELSLLLLMAVHFRLLSPEWLIAKRRIMFVGVFIVGGVLTPPDVLSQLLLAFPLIGIYELAIIYAKWRHCSVLSSQMHL